MIVKNEEALLENCLNSVKNLVSEIIIVDTGSTDNTKIISRKFTNLIFDYKWENDFASARNYSLSKATGDWILILDADEYIDINTINVLKAFIKDPKYMEIISAKIESIYSDGRKTFHCMTRFFKNNVGLKFKYKLHEQLFSEKDEIKLYKLNGFNIYHNGYSSEYKNRTEKLFRNEIILLDQIKEDPTTAFHYYNLQNVYHSQKRFSESLIMFYSMLKCMPEYSPKKGNNFIPHSFLVAISCLIEEKKFEEAFKLIEEGSKFKTGLNYYYYFKAFCLFKIKQFTKSLMYLTLSLNIKSIPLIIQGDISAGICILFGHNLFNLKKYNSAIDYYKKIKNINKDKYKEIENLISLCYAKLAESK